VSTPVPPPARRGGPRVPDRGAHGRGDDESARVPLSPGAAHVHELDLTQRLTTARDRLDASRGAAAVERELIVHCVEQADLGTCGSGSREPLAHPALQIIRPTGRQ